MMPRTLPRRPRAVSFHKTSTWRLAPRPAFGVIRAESFRHVPLPSLAVGLHHRGSRFDDVRRGIERAQHARLIDDDELHHQATRLVSSFDVEGHDEEALADSPCCPA